MGLLNQNQLSARERVRSSILHWTEQTSYHQNLSKQKTDC